MLASQVIMDARRELLETTGIFWSDAELLRHLNKGELDFVNKTRILEDTAQLTLVQGQSDYPLPQNFLSSKPVFLKIVDSSGTLIEWRRVRPSSLEKVAQQTPNFLDTSTSSSQGEPTAYWIWGRSLRLNRAPSAEYATVLYLFYKSKPIPITVTSQSINVDDAFGDALTAYILWKAWKKEKQYDLAEGALAEYMSGVSEGRKFVKKQTGDLRNQMDIESSSGFAGSPFA